jgi:YesN/AraC family two-component response regulator
MNERFDIVISDLKMPGMNGLSLLAWTAKHAPNTKRILLTGFTDIEATAELVAEAEIFKVLHKPWDSQDLINILMSALAVSQAGGVKL